MNWRTILVALLLTGVCGIYFLRAYERVPRHTGYKWERYALLTDSFLAGQTSLLVKPAPELLALPDPMDAQANERYRLHDASLYSGKYYLYFGPVPALLLFLPYKVIAHANFRQDLAVPLFCAAGFLCSYAFLCGIAKREKWVWPFWLEATLILLLGTCSFTLFLVSRPMFYEVAVASAYFFLMAGFLLLAHALAHQPIRLSALSAAALCIGLSAGCRPNFAVVAVVITLLLGVKLKWRMQPFLAFLSPVAICGMLLASYNFVRFHDPLEFGISYQLTSVSRSIHRVPIASIARIGQAAYQYLFLAPAFDHTFPYAHPTLIWGFPGIGPKEEPVVGVLPAIPLIALALCAPLERIRQIDAFSGPSTKSVISIMYAAGIAAFASVVATGWVFGRYMVDFAGPLVVVMCYLLGVLWQYSRDMPRSRSLGFKVCVVTIGIAATLQNLLFATPPTVLQHFAR